jgi:acetamidase/formamidase
MKEKSGAGVSRAINHSIHSRHHHHGWDNSFAPVLRVAPGETVTFDMIDASGGQLGPDSGVDVIRRWEFDRVNPVTGPVLVDGAQPGDALKITIIEAAPSRWGWTGNFPGFGLLSDQFPDPALYHWTCDTASLAPAAFGKFARVPLKPFPGTIGVAPAAPGHHSIMPPRRVGGNLDMRDISVGAELLLPVEVEGAMFSIGDGHAAQGDGEVCGSAIETPMSATVKLEVLKAAHLSSPRVIVRDPVSRHLDGRGYDITVGIGAVSDMIDLLAAREGMTPTEAYMLCSVCADLRINEIVDRPNWIVGCYMPRIVFE